MRMGTVTGASLGDRFFSEGLTLYTALHFNFLFETTRLILIGLGVGQDLAGNRQYDTDLMVSNLRMSSSILTSAYRSTSAE